MKIDEDVSEFKEVRFPEDSISAEPPLQRSLYDKRKSGRTTNQNNER